MAADVIADGLCQAEADGPDKAYAQCVVKHGFIMLAEGNTGVNCSCLRKTGQNITHNKLNLEEYRVSGQKLAAESRALVHEAVDHDNHAEHAHRQMRAALQHLAAGGAGENFFKRYGSEWQWLVLPIEVENSQKAGDISNAGGGGYACYFKVTNNDEEHIKYKVDDIAGKSGEHGDTHMQCPGEPALRRLKNQCQRHNPDQQAIITLEHGLGGGIGVEQQKCCAPDWLLQNDKQKADTEGGEHAAQEGTCEQLGVMMPHRLGRKAAGGDFQKAEQPIDGAEDNCTKRNGVNIGVIAQVTDDSSIDCSHERSCHRGKGEGQTCFYKAHVR